MNRIIIFIILASTTSAHALDRHPSRVRLLIHANHSVSEQLDIRAHFIPAGNLLGELAPLIYTGVAYKPTAWFEIETDIGWVFKPNEILVSLKPSASFGNFWVWSELDIQYPSYSGYWFAQAEYHALSCLHIGAEGEGWGDFRNGDTWSHGGGPNVLLRFGDHVGLDLAAHFRNLPDKGDGIEFFARVHLFL